MPLDDKHLVTDQYLLENLRNSNQGVFELVFNFYYSGLVVFADKIMRNTAVSEDIVQSVFLKFWETRQTVEIKSLKAYFVQCVKNKCIDHIRNQQVKSKFDAHYLETEVSLSEEDLWTKNELAHLLEIAIADLPPRCREVFWMSRYENYKVSEIAEKLNISKRTVETQISKALKILRVKLIDYISLIFLYFFLK
jgi:RNA polymerase sigma-70 factor, Bacteroides expansion family 1